MNSNTNDKRNQLDNYLSDVQEAERKKKKKTIIIITLLAIIGLGTAKGIYYFKEEKPKYRTLLEDDMTIYKMDSIFKADNSPIILTRKFSDEIDTIQSVDDYIDLTVDGNPEITVAMLDGVDTVELPMEEEMTNELIGNDLASSNVELEKTAVEKMTPKISIPPKFVFDILGNRAVGEKLEFSIENYNPKFAYILDFGNGVKQSIREKKVYAYPKAGNFKLSLITTNSQGGKSRYTKTIKIAPIKQAASKIVENNTGDEISQKSEFEGKGIETKPPKATDSVGSKPETVSNPLASIEKNAAISPEITEKKPAKSSKVSVSTGAPVSFAEKMPSFPGGTSAMYKFLNKKLKYPRLARENEVQGKVYIQFVVGVDGSLSNFKLMRGLGYGCDEEALRIAKLMPKWLAGEQGGQKVAVVYTLTVNFKFK